MAERSRTGSNNNDVEIIKVDPALVQITAPNCEVSKIYSSWLITYSLCTIGHTVFGTITDQASHKCVY